MERILKKALACVVAAALLGGFGVLSAGAQEANPTPADLLGEGYNPFYGMEFPDGYTIDWVFYNQGDHTYHLDIDAQASGETVVTEMLRLLGYDDPDSISRCVESIQNAGAAGIESYSADTGATVSCDIKDYEHNGSCSIDLYQTAQDSAAYDSFMAANFNLEAIGTLAEYLDISAADETEFNIKPETGFAMMMLTFSLPNAKEIRAELIDAFQDDYTQDGDCLEFWYGDLQTSVRFDSVIDGLIILQQHMDTTDVCFGSYVPPITLRNFGFKGDLEENAKCGFSDKVNGVYILLSKSEWGENENTDERNAIRFMKDIGEDGYMVTYYPDGDRAAIQLSVGEDTAKYVVCNLTDGGLLYLTDGSLSDARETVQRMFPDSDNALYEPLTSFEAYITETFGMSPNELYAVVYE